MKRLLSAIGLGLVLAAGQATADIVFTLDATFDDGGILTGTFTTNDAITSVLDYDVTTSGGTLVGFEYTPATAPVNISSLPTFFGVEDAGPDHILQVTFDPPLVATGGTVKLGQFDSFEQVPGGVHRQITEGSATTGTTAAPEPGTLALLSLAAIAFGVARRRKSA